MLARAAAALVLAALALTACSRSDGPAPSPECTVGPRELAKALRAAPGDVRLVDGTPISDCVGRARSDSNLQNIGLALTRVAEDLEAGARTAPRPALELGYLIGAARRGAPHDSSLQAELVYRLERSAAVSMPPECERALVEGMRAGERRG
ncbi:MAG TPA: hypothetical protein VGW75_13300 [Solirubrobacteraceae bacterium]|jgi:hypothetical protein|nr:hypothetical protein [Solirubrobacteraceae bacterium]